MPGTDSSLNARRAKSVMAPYINVWIRTYGNRIKTSVRFNENMYKEYSERLNKVTFSITDENNRPTPRKTKDLLASVARNGYLTMQ